MEITELYEKRYQDVSIDSPDEWETYMVSELDGSLLAIFPNEGLALKWLKSMDYHETTPGFWTKSKPRSKTK